MNRVRDHLTVAIVSGIYPPDIGGPATHAADLALALRQRNVEVAVLSLTDETHVMRSRELQRLPRRWPWPLRFVAVVLWLIRHHRRFDVVYATGMQAEAITASFFNRVPTIIKIVGDPAWERGVRLGLTTSDFEGFQRQGDGGPRLHAMRWVRTAAARHARSIVVPSRYLANVVLGWVPGLEVHVVPNGVQVPEGMPREQSVQARPGLDALYVGRLVPWKGVDVLIEAVALTPGVDLEIVGDGPDRERLESLARRLEVCHRISFAGVLDHEEVLRYMARADVLVSASTYEGLPHTVIESLAVGTPVVASTAGGTTEALQDDVNGIVIERPSAVDLAHALARLRDDDALRSRLSKGAARSGRDWRFDASVDRLEDLFYSVRRDKAALNDSQSEEAR